MKTAGMIGGLGPESTIAYYRALIAMYRDRTADGSYPPILINSVDLTKVLQLVAAGRLDELADYLLTELRSIARAGADFGFIAANTPHVVFDELRQASPIPMISIVEATRAKAQTLGLTRLGIFGTRFTMQGGFYHDVFSQAGITLVAPSEDERAYVHEKYVTELVNGITRPETRERLLRIVEHVRDEHGIDGLILGGTELPLILPDAGYGGVPFLDTALIHADRIIEEMVS
jgi:aspartate racemase